MFSSRALMSVVVTSVVFAGAVTAAEENWPQWRGPGGQGVSTETRVPTEWTADTNIRWKTELPGTGMSSPIIWGDRIYVTAVVEGDAVPGQRAVKHRQGKEEDWIHPDSVAADKTHTFKVVSVDATSGKIVWDRTAYEGTVFDARHRRSSFAGPTPATDGVMVYAYFGPEGLFAYDASGALAWTAGEKFATLGLGTGTSPVLYQNLVIIQRDEDNGEHSALVAYDKKSGKEIWRTKRTIEISWSTPVLVDAGGRTELVTNGNERIIAYDPATGKELWQTAGVQSNAIHTPLIGHGLVIMTAGYPAKKSSLFAREPSRTRSASPGNTRAARATSSRTSSTVTISTSSPTMASSRVWIRRRERSSTRGAGSRSPHASWDHLSHSPASWR